MAPNRVPLVCTPEDLYRAMADVAKVVNGPPIFGGPALIPESVLALFRPAEEPEPTPVRCGRCGGTVHEWTNGIGGRGASCTSCGFGWGCATPAAPAAPPPAGEPGKCRDCGGPLSPEDVADGLTAHAYTVCVAALRAENERYAAVLRLCAGDVVTCYPTDDGTVKVAVNLNDYFVPASDGEEIEMADAPTLVTLFDHGGWPAVYQWVADRRGVPNRHWRLKPPIDSASVPPGENRSEG